MTYTIPNALDSRVRGNDGFRGNDGGSAGSWRKETGTPETRTYDSWGRLATRAQGTYAATYGYRYGGRLHSFTSNFPGEAAAATLEYRSDGRLHKRTVGTDIKVYRYDAGWNAINTEDNAGALLASSVYEPGQEVGQRLAYSYGSLSTGTVVYAYHDQLGSTRRWRLNKSNWGANEYEPYGEAYAVSTLAPRDYALHEWDPAIAAYRAPYRNYSPAMARWMTRDPLGMVDGPNMYGYVGGRAVSRKDMLGLTIWAGPFPRGLPVPPVMPTPPGTECFAKQFACYAAAEALYIAQSTALSAHRAIQNQICHIYTTIEGREECLEDVKAETDPWEKQINNTYETMRAFCDSIATS